MVVLTAPSTPDHPHNPIGTPTAVAGGALTISDLATQAMFDVGCPNGHREMNPSR